MESKLIYVGGPSDRGVVRWRGTWVQSARKHCTSEGRHYSYAEWYGADGCLNGIHVAALPLCDIHLAARPLLNGIHVAARPLCDIHFLVTA